MAGKATIGLDDVEPPLLALDAAEAGGRGELALVRHLEQRVPIDRRVVFRRRGCTRCRHRGQIENLAWRGRRLGGIDEPVAANPDAVIGPRKLRQQIAAALVGDDDLDELGGKFRGFGDHPHPGFRAVGAGDFPAKIALPDLDGGGGRLRGERRE